MVRAMDAGARLTGRPERRSVASAAAVALARVDPSLANGRGFSLAFWDGSRLPAHDGAAPTVTVRRPRALAYLLRSPGQLGLSRAYVMGDADVADDELEPLLAQASSYAGIRIRPAAALAAAAAAPRLARHALRRAPAPPEEARLRGPLHSLRRDRDAIAHHYDISNEFYGLLLGPTLVYSCAYFEHADDSLEVAQERKLDRVCRKLGLASGHRLLDVGCGWGSLALHAAARYGARVVGITLSEPQAQLARRRAQERGLAERCEFRVADYRELADVQFDRIASIGMIEHVPRAQLGEYAARLRRLLRPGGLLLNQGIVQVGATPWNQGPFISRYVFPDGELETIGALAGALERSDFEVRDVESLREHYPLTLRRWIANLDAHRDAVRREVGAGRERVWRLYMTGSILAFQESRLAVHQVLAAAKGAPHGLPLARRS
jgi:cyclopropane-fatty-acyl-phospholipid synthase